MTQIPTFLIVLEAISFPFVLLLIFKVIIPKLMVKTAERLEKVGSNVFGRGNYQMSSNNFEVFGQGLFEVPVLKGKMNDLDVLLASRAGSKHSPPETQAFIAAPVKTPLQVTRENFSHSIGKTLGFTSEIQIGDSELDKSFFFKTSDELQARSFVSNGEFRELLRTSLRDEHFGRLLFITQEDIDKNTYYNDLQFKIASPGILYSRYVVIKDEHDHILALQSAIQKTTALGQRLQ